MSTSTTFAKGDRVIVTTLRGEERAEVEYAINGADHPQVTVHFDDDTYCMFSASRVRHDTDLLEALRAEAARPESLAARQAATAAAEAEFLADLDAEEALTVEHAQAGDRVEVATGSGFLTVTVDRVGGFAHGWASVTYHHDNGFSMTRRFLCSTPVTRPAIIESAV